MQEVCTSERAGAKDVLCSQYVCWPCLQGLDMNDVWVLTTHKEADVSNRQHTPYSHIALNPVCVLNFLCLPSKTIL